MKPVFAGRQPDVTEENIQARIRGSLLMAISNKFGALLLTTGNKSEIGVGYCTLYGDMCGGLAVISDVPKTLVYALSRVRQSRMAAMIPRSTIEKPPSAELRPGSKGQRLAAALRGTGYHPADYVENNHAPAQIAEEHGFDLELVRKM